MKGQGFFICTCKVQLAQRSQLSVSCWLNHCDFGGFSVAIFGCQRPIFPGLFNSSNKFQGFLVMGAFGSGFSYVFFKGRLSFIQVGSLVHYPATIIKVIGGFVAFQALYPVQVLTGFAPVLCCNSFLGCQHQPAHLVLWCQSRCLSGQQCGSQNQPSRQLTTFNQPYCHHTHSCWLSASAVCDSVSDHSNSGSSTGSSSPPLSTSAWSIITFGSSFLTRTPSSTNRLAWETRLPRPLVNVFIAAS